MRLFRQAATDLPLFLCSAIKRVAAILNHPLSGDLDAACYGLNQELDFWADQHKPVMMSEYGADTLAGLHTAGAEMFSEEFQVEFYRRLDAEFDKRPWFVGEFVWNFADYDGVRSTFCGHPHRSQGYLPGP